MRIEVEHVICEIIIVVNFLVDLKSDAKIIIMPIMYKILGQKSAFI